MFWGLVPGSGPQQAWLATALASFVLALPAIRLSNLAFDKNAASSYVIRRWGSELEKLLLVAFERYPSILISISLKTGKVYIGWPAFEPPLLETKTEYIRLLPAISGYRNPPQMTLTLTTDYAAVYEAINDGDAPEGLKASDFEVVIPTSEIVSANLYTPDIDRSIFRPRDEMADDPTTQGR